eukprot:497895_1
MYECIYNFFGTILELQIKTWSTTIDIIIISLCYHKSFAWALVHIIAYEQKFVFFSSINIFKGYLMIFNREYIGNRGDAIYSQGEGSTACACFFIYTYIVCLVLVCGLLLFFMCFVPQCMSVIKSTYLYLFKIVNEKKK